MVVMSPLLELAATQHGLLTRGQVTESGLTSRVIDGRLHSGEWVRVGKGVYRVAGAPVTWRQRLLAAVLVAGPGAVASHASAAALWGLPGFREGPIHVVRPTARSRSAHIGVLHETDTLPRSQVRVVDGIPVASPERTLFDLCGHFRGRRARVARSAVANAIRLGLTTLGRLAGLVAELGVRGRAGTAGLRRVIAELDDGEPITESELEDLVVSVLASAGIPSPKRQVTIGGTTAPIGRVDFLIPPRVVIEADSRSWHGAWETREADLLRDAMLRPLGYEVIRTTWRMLTEHPEVFVAAVRAALAEAA